MTLLKTQKNPYQKIKSQISHYTAYRADRENITTAAYLCWYQSKKHTKLRGQSLVFAFILLWQRVISLKSLQSFQMKFYQFRAHSSHLHRKLNETRTTLLPKTIQLMYNSKSHLDLSIFSAPFFRSPCRQKVTRQR